MLLSLLPSLRDLRTPFAVGSLWLANLWLLFGQEIPRSAAPGAPDELRLAYEAGHVLGRPALLAALSFLAYLLGAALSWDIRAYRLRSFLGRQFPSRSDVCYTQYEYVELASHWSSEHEERKEHYRDVGGGYEFSKDTVAFLEKTLLTRRRMKWSAKTMMNGSLAGVRSLRFRLIAVNMEMYQEFDRLAAESKLRTNLMLPMAVLAAESVVAGRTQNLTGTFWLVPAALLAFGATLFIQGLLIDLDADAIVMRAVIQRIIVLPDQEAVQPRKASTQSGEGPS